MEFNLYSDRSLTPTNRNRGVENENKSQLLCIYIQDKTLLDKKAFIEFKTDSEERYITERLTISEDGAIVYQLLNGLMQTEYLQFQVIFTDDYNWVWKSVVKEILIQNSINTADQLAKEYPDFISNAQEVLSQVEEVAETVVEKVDEIEETVNEYTQRVEQVEQTVEEYTQAEESRVQAENLRVANETQRIANENQRVSNEQTRVSNESARQTQETTRQANESTRQTNEETRKQNEISRQNAETIRENTFTTNEANRQSTFQTNEATRQSNESTRQTNESTRVSQESTRQTQESSRVNAESLRVSAENTRVSNEASRQTNEETRIENETTREQNEATRIANEEARVQAEAERAAEFATWEDEIDSKADKDYVDKKDTNLQYEIADLKAKLYETVVGVKQLETEYASEIDIPTHITEDSVAYPVLDNTAMEVANIKGRSVVVNQLLQNPDFISSGANWSAYYYGGSTSWSGGILTIRKSDGTCDISQLLSETIQSGHKILFMARLKTKNSNNVSFAGTGWATNAFVSKTTFDTYYKIIDLTINIQRIYIACYGTEDVEMSVDYVYLIDLTQMFDGNIPQDLLDNPSHFSWYYNGDLSYNAGSLKNVNVEKIESYTANVWDEEWEVVSGHIESKNFVSVKPNTQYYFYGPIISPQLYGNGVSLYDVNKNFLGNAYLQGQVIFTIPNGCRYIKLALTSNYGTTYNHDISVYKGSTNLGYIPSKKLGSIALPNIDLRGVNDIQDTLAFVEQENGTYNLEHTQYVGRVDLGTLNWLYDSSRQLFFTTIEDRKGGNILTMLCSMYKLTLNATPNNIENMCFRPYYFNTNYDVILKNTSYTDATTFKAAMSGVMLYYELATPVKTVIATGLLFDEVSLLINKYGRIEVVNRSSDNVNADTTFNVAVKEFKDE